MTARSAHRLAKAAEVLPCLDPEALELMDCGRIWLAGASMPGFEVSRECGKCGSRKGLSKTRFLCYAWGFRHGIALV